MIVDTDVLIWASRGNARAVEILDEHAGFFISVVTYAEILQGARDRNEVRSFQKALRFWRAKTLHISEPISQRAMFLVERYALSHSVNLSDALIAATAIQHGETLMTGNRKHYSVIPDLDISEFKP